MNINQWRWVTAGLVYIFILASGYWLSRSGKPYSFIFLNLHKLVALGSFVILIVTVFKAHPLPSLTPFEVVVVGVTVLCFVATIVSGGLLTIEKVLPNFLTRLHQILPYATGLASATAFYFLRITG